MKISFKRIIILPVAILAFIFAFMQFKSASAAEVDSWGPQDRETFLWDKPATYRTFNSITDNPVLGDERNFVRVKEVGVDGPHYDTVDVVPGKEYEVYIYYHNNASASLNASGKGIADNVRLATKLPERLEAGQTGVVYGTISSTNTKPESVWDTAYLKATDTVFLRYVWDSATIHNAGTANGAILDANALFSEEGAKLAYNLERADNGESAWGMVPGCNEYAGYVTYRVKADQPGFGVEKEVSAENKNLFADNITTTPGAVLDFKIFYKNSGTTAQSAVTMYDIMPDGMEYVAGSTFVKTTDDPTGKYVSDGLFNGGIIIGDFDAGEEATVTYKAKIRDDINKFPCGSTTVYNESSTATANGTITDKARIIVVRECTTNTPKELPTTGPGEIILAAGIVVVIIGGGIYFYHSRKMLKKATSAAGSSADGSVSDSASSSVSDDINADDFMKQAPTQGNENTSTPLENESSAALENENAAPVSTTSTPQDDKGDIVKDSIQNNPSA
ncbi:DUF11 domain-containing protein [Candidatus Saccharibacteria bacterium]|nr:DUF11 domain-containing protein [Candidatus Saccharibacteria bacterium]